MKSYQLTYLISADLSEEEVRAFQEKINSLIQEEGGILIETNSAIKKTLAYPIKKKKTAFLASLSFQIWPERLESLEKKLKRESNILRYQILSKKLPKVALPIKKPEKAIKPKPKVELEELEKKLEEILEE